jgi:hypothetical protein
MKTLKRTVPLWLFAVALIAMISVAVAAVQIQWSINSTVNVASAFGLKVYDFATKTVEITTFGFGNCSVGQTVNSTISVVVKNVGNTPLYVGWNVTNQPTGFTLGCQDLDSGAWLNQTNKFDYFAAVQPGQYWGTNNNRYLWYLTNTAAGAGSYSFTIKILGADSSTG